MKDNAKYMRRCVKSEDEMRRLLTEEDLQKAIASEAKRHAVKHVDRREEYRNDGWMSVAQEKTTDIDKLIHCARLGIRAAYRRRLREVDYEVELAYVGGTMELQMLEEIMEAKATGKTPKRGGSDNPSYGGDGDYLGDNSVDG